mmetsp:Transcript_14218/g.25708  ORF Transcript_14218/g.25708 Transcript_14218/m.25708 type:complete len:98 (-) Transcript_14218:512-805(-)
MIMSIVCPLKFQPTLDGSCGTRMQMGTSSGLGSVAMKSDSESVSFCEGATAMPGGAGKPGGGMGVALGGAGGTGAPSVLSLFAGGSPDGTAGAAIAC